MKQLKENKGFSLVELIIVIAIMAILVGVVGTQVVPYLNRSKVAKDLQLISAYNTAAVSAFSMNADKMPATGTLSFTMFQASSVSDPDEKAACQLIEDTVKELVGDADLNALKAKMTSDQKSVISGVKFTFKISSRTVETEALTAPKLGKIESYL